MAQPEDRAEPCSSDHTRMTPQGKGCGFARGFSGLRQRSALQRPRGNLATSEDEGQRQQCLNLSAYTSPAFNCKPKLKEKIG